ncbi:MAG TPA: PH domain-containing protein [Bryobacteraceae bacterium]|jgi:hypothetical protein|nr:PH domain-containing protein [Bryobacteraceae bacterium]
MDDFSVSYDRTTKIVTALACVLLGIPAATIHNLAVRIVAILTVLVSFAFSVKSYSYAEGVVVVNRLIGNVRVPPGPPTYSLTRDALTIHDRFYPVTVPADAVDVDHIRVVDFTQDQDWRPTMRTNGVGLSHYKSGWFRVASGRTVRMYRADSKRLVLLPPKGDAAPILYEVKDPEQFVRSLQQEWAGRS